MRLARPGRSAVALAAATCLGALGLAGLPAGSALAAPAAVKAKPNHYNVGAPHSPRLLRELAGKAGVKAAPATAEKAAIAAASTSVQGVDVASYQHPNGAAIDWASVAGAGYKFAAIKVTEGNYYVNPYATGTSDPPGDLAGAASAGLFVIAYAFANPAAGNGTAAQQADYAVTNATVGGNVPPIMLDIEYNPYGAECYGLTQAQMITWIRSFATEVAARTGHLPIIYTTRDWWQSCTGGATTFGGDPMWVASYTGTSSPGAIPAGWSGWAAWQYESSGNVPGIATTGATDLDVLSSASFLDAASGLAMFRPGPQDQAGRTVPPVQAGASTQPSGGSVSYSETGLPASLSMSTSTGQVTGKAPATPGAYPVTVTATSLATSGKVTFDWDVHGTIAMASPGNQTTTAGATVGLTKIKATDSVSGQVPSFWAQGLPPGLWIDSGTGAVRGWPDKPGSYHVMVVATDPLGARKPVSFTWTIKAASTAGPAGPVRLNLGGKCLDDSGNKTTSGNKIDIWACNGSTAQKWTVVQDGTLRIHGKCLGTKGGGTASGTVVQLQSCTGAPGQQWQAGSNAQLINPVSGKCLADPGSSTANGKQAWIWSCLGTANQQWTLPAVPVRSLLPGKCMDDAGSRTTAGNKIDIYSCHKTAAQAWTIAADGTLRVRGHCLTVAGNGTAAGTLVQLEPCAAAAGQLWQIDGSGDLVNPASSLCLATSGGGTANGTALDIATCSGVITQTWRAW